METPTVFDRYSDALASAESDLCEGLPPTVYRITALPWCNSQFFTDRLSDAVAYAVVMAGDFGKATVERARGSAGVAASAWVTIRKIAVQSENTDPEVKRP